jgi:hypothetical protein
MERAMPTAHKYQPAVQDDSTPGARVTVKRLSKGSYAVRFGKSGGPYLDNGGHVQVVAVGSRDRRCVVTDWSAQASPVADISCYNDSGNPADSEFAIQWILDRLIV